MRPLFPAILASLMLLSTSLSSAQDCMPSTSATSLDMIVVEADGRYLVNDLCQPDCSFSIWLYEETNGIPGLQRGDRDDWVDDTCGGAIPPDVLLN